MKKVEYYGQEIAIPDDHYFVATDDDGEVCSYAERPDFYNLDSDHYWYDDDYHAVMFRDDLASMSKDTLVEYPKEG